MTGDSAQEAWDAFMASCKPPNATTIHFTQPSEVELRMYDDARRRNHAP